MKRANISGNVSVVLFNPPSKAHADMRAGRVNELERALLFGPDTAHGRHETRTKILCRIWQLVQPHLRVSEQRAVGGHFAHIKKNNGLHNADMHKGRA